MRRALGPGEASEPRTTAVAVDASEIGTMSSRRVDDVADKATRAVVDAGLSPAAVRVTFVEIDPVAVLRGVRVSIAADEAAVTDPDDPRGPLLASCTACSDAELAGLAIEAVLEAIELHEDALEAQRAAAEAATAVAPSPTEPEARPTPPPAAAPRRPLGALGGVGVAMLGVGVGAAVTGAVLASRPPAPYPGEPRVDVLRDLRPPGYAVLGVGAALLVTGAVLLVVDRRKARARRLAGAPWVGPGALGITLALPL
jgi:hypothetical protein